MDPLRRYPGNYRPYNSSSDEEIQELIVTVYDRHEDDDYDDDDEEEEEMPRWMSLLLFVTLAVMLTCLLLVGILFLVENENATKKLTEAVLYDR